MITKEEVKALAVLSKLEICEDELDETVADMAEIIKFAERIKTTDIAFAEECEESEVGSLRADEPTAPSSRERILENAGDIKDEYFSVFRSCDN